VERGTQEVTACIQFSVADMKKAVIIFPKSSSFMYRLLSK